MSEQLVTATTQMNATVFHLFFIEFWHFGKFLYLKEALTANSLSGSFSPFRKGREYWKRSTSLVL